MQFRFLIPILALWIRCVCAQSESIIEVIAPGESWTVPAEVTLTVDQVVRIGDHPDDVWMQAILPGEKTRTLRATGTAAKDVSSQGLQFPGGSRFINPEQNPGRIAILGEVQETDTLPPPPEKEQDYYGSVRGKSGEVLKDSLHEVIRDHQRHSYNTLWEKLRSTDEDPQNPENVLLFYSGWSRDKNRNGGNISDWNREHTWPKSHGSFSPNSPMATDLHHIRATDVTVNSRRGHLNFDRGGDLVVDNDGPTRNRVDQNSWEPRDEVKGDVARMIFYMVVRYEGTRSGEPDLELSDKVNNVRNPRLGKISVLKAWHQEDPVDDQERIRNERVFEIQGNRNPFIDHPEWVRLIWGE